MAMQGVHQHEDSPRECFLCSLDPRSPCHRVQLEGRIVAAQERLIDGARTPIFVLDTGSERVEVALADQYYRGLVRELKMRGAAIGAYQLTLRLYHLPFPASSSEYRDKTRPCYKGNAYTLAVLNPDTLLNITDLNQAEYCSRQYLLNRLSPSPVSTATLRGNLVHYCFKELLKEHDRGVFSERGDGAETPLAALHRHLEQALTLSSLDLALANVSVEAMRAEVAPHLESLAFWYRNERETLWDMPAAYSDEQEEAAQRSQVRAETFLLAPEIGLRGRLDLFWQQAGRQRLLELKTGGASGALPRREHRWQVFGYHALLTVRRDPRMKKALATLLYSGTPGQAQAFGIPATIREIQRVNETRNTLVLSHVTGIPAPPPGPTRCRKCAMLQTCQLVSSLLQWQPPEPGEGGPDEQRNTDLPGGDVAQPEKLYRQPINTDEDRDFFARYYHLLQIEGEAGEQQQALLWKTPVEERLERGTAIRGLQAVGEAKVERDGWEQTFRCTNGSELREGDEILLSNGDPIAGEVVSGTILRISSEQVTVWTREVIAQPVLIDRYDNDLVHVRTQQNLLRWLRANVHLRDLVAGKVRPRFIARSCNERADFNAEQNLAVRRALQMQDYLLIQGPPGTGKTSVIAEIIRQLTGQGQRVLLAAFTNQAVDNMLKRLDKEGFHDYLRLGHERSVDESVRGRLLKELVGPDPDASAVRTLLHSMPVVASTSATWSSDKYSSQALEGNEQSSEEMGLSFDVAIIDEAGQLTVPAILGALRFARRFILVGDEKQLPPLVLSKEAAENGLANSLFGLLKRLDDGYMQRQEMIVSACVALRTQYRMNRWISHFSSTVFYDGQLVAHPSIANRRLAFTQPPSRQSAEREAACFTQALDPTRPLVFLDIGRAEEDDEESDAKISSGEARAVRSLVASLLARGIQERDIGIIAPYRAQVAHIRRHLFRGDATPDGWQGLAIDSPISVDTVDRFQGGERQVIIMSFATTREPPVISQRREFLLNPNRLNVALTRAQSKLIVVGCVPALAPLPIFSRLVTYCRSMGTLLHYGEGEVSATRSASASPVG